MDDAVDRRALTPEELDEARRYALVIEWSAEDDAFIASAPDLPGVVTHGATREEAAAMGDEVVATWLTATRAAELPTPPPARNGRRVDAARPSVFDAARIRRIRGNLNLSQHAFADLLNVSPQTARAWEQGEQIPDGPALRLLAVAERHPEALVDSAGLPDVEAASA